MFSDALSGAVRIYQTGELLLIVDSCSTLLSRFDRFVVSVMVPCLERIGWNKMTGESHLKSMLRGLLICQLGTRGCDTVEAKCQQLFNNWLGAGSLESETVEPGLREVVMKVSMASCPQHHTLDSLLKLLDTPQERNRVLHSLGYPKNRDVLDGKGFRLPGKIGLVNVSYGYAGQIFPEELNHRVVDIPVFKFDSVEAFLASQEEATTA